MHAHTGQRRRRSMPIMGPAVTVIVSARKTGPRIAAKAFIPATEITVAASPSSTITPRGRDHSPGAAGSGVGTGVDILSAASGHAAYLDQPQAEPVQPGDEAEQ